MDRFNAWNESLKKAYADELLEKYRIGLCDLSTFASMLHDIPKFDVADFIRRSIPHEERWLEVQRIRKNTTLHKDGIQILERLYLGC